MIYKTLKELYVPGIIAYIKDKKCYILYSRNLLQSLTRLMEEYKDYELMVLETEVPEDLLKVRHKFWIKWYAGLGYEILNKRKPVNYSIKIVINKDFLVDIWLYPAHSRRKLLGTFNNMEEAKEFSKVQELKYLCTETCT